jgi:hypothetical protein
MNYFITTLAVNEPYFSKSIDFYTSLHDRTEMGFFNITTSVEDLKRLKDITKLTYEEFKEKYPKLFITLVEDFNRQPNFPLNMEGEGFTFNLNLKVLALKACLKKNIPFEYIIFIDGDWGLHNNFNEKKLLSFFDNLEMMNIDMAFERPAQIGNYKKNNLQNCFFEEKLRDYNVMEHEIWDDAHVVNEQFLGFRNNWNFRLFVQKWEQMLWYTIANNIRNYPDGFEIGVAALESKKKLFEETRDNILKEKQSIANLQGTLSQASTTQFTDKNGNLVVRSNNAALKNIARFDPTKPQPPVINIEFII